MTDKEKLAQWMIAQGYATGHGDTVEELLASLELEVRDKCNVYMDIHDAVVKDNDRARELLGRAENEMRYAGWTKYESDNSARNGVYEQIKDFLK